MRLREGHPKDKVLGINFSVNIARTETGPNQTHISQDKKQEAEPNAGPKQAHMPD